jgi:hypothetical protein
MGIPLEKFKTLRFGTSGLRDTVQNMTDMECYINTRGFLGYLNRVGEFNKGTVVALGGDRRQSTPRIKRTVAAAVRDKEGKVDNQGLTSTPALTSALPSKRGFLVLQLSPTTGPIFGLMSTTLQVTVHFCILRPVHCSRRSRSRSAPAAATVWNTMRES